MLLSVTGASATVPTSTFPFWMLDPVFAEVFPVETLPASVVAGVLVVEPELFTNRPVTGSRAGSWRVV